MDKAQEKIAEGLIEICNLAQEGLCLESKWGKCIFPEQDNNDGHKCGLCFAKYITEELGYRKLPEGKPPLLSDARVRVLVCKIMTGNWIAEDFAELAQAQWDICIKWYEGEE